MNARELARRALLALAVHVLLVLAWPLVRPLYAPWFRASNQLAMAFLDPLPEPIEVRFVPGSDPALARDLVGMDTLVLLEHRELAGAGRFGASSSLHGWFPTTVLLALFVAATPRPWRERRWPLVAALVLLQGFVALRCLVGVLYSHAQSAVDGRPLVELSAAGARALRLAWHLAWSEMLVNYLAPLAIWGLCAFKPGSRLA